MDEKILIINDDKYINDSQEAFNDTYFGSKRNTHMKKTYIVGVIISVMLLAACSNNVKPDTNNEVVTPSPTPIGFEHIPATDSPVSDVPLPTQVPTIAEPNPTQMPSVDIEVPLTELEMLPRNLASPFSAKVKEYYDAQSEYGNTGILPDPRESDLNSLYFVYPGMRNDINSTQTYLLYDLNNDGTPELFIARHYSSGYEQPDVIYDAYIWDDGQIKRLMNEKEIGYRNGTCEIREGGYILSFYSGSAWDFGYDVYRLDNDSKQLRWIERIYAVKETENGNDDSRYYWSSSEFADKKQISEERYQRLIGRYRTPELQFVENNGPQIS